MNRDPASTARARAVIETMPLAGATPQRWRNGGGTTRELLAWPSAADWQLRISVADIAANGPFSAFPGVQRVFAVLEGAGVRLGFEEHGEVLGPDSDPLAFDGNDAPRCELLDGPTRDLNLMVRADAGRGAMQRALAGDDWVSAAPLRALFTSAEVWLQIDGAAAATVSADTLAWSTHAGGQRWRIVAGAAEEPRAWWMDFRRISS